VVVRAIVLLALIAMLLVAVQYWRARQVREAVWAAFTPVQITNCELQRFGPDNDGGYLQCANLLQDAKAAYSYGIAGYDPWGCVVVDALKVPLHQYDCFDTTVPRCTSAPAPSPMFHAECIGPARETIDGRPYDTLGNQIAANGDAGKRVIVKMDVEGSEWDSLRTAPDEVLMNIDQLTIEFHDPEVEGAAEAAARLTRFFHVVHVHQNNYACLPGFEPFPGPIFEALLVNKRIATANPAVVTRGVLPIDSPNSPLTPDCQASPGGGEPRRVTQWLRRKAGAVGWRLFGVPFS
jgi:hypothetical protein